MSDIVQKAKVAYRNAYPDKLEGNAEIKKAFWNGYMCRVVDEEQEALKAFKQAGKYTSEELVDAFTFND